MRKAQTSREIELKYAPSFELRALAVRQYGLMSENEVRETKSHDLRMEIITFELEAGIIRPYQFRARKKRK